MTPDQIEFIRKNNCTQLTADGDNSLYLTPIGAYTIAQAVEITELHRKYREALQAARPHDKRLWDDVVSDEMSIRNDRSIDQNGCGLF